MRMIIKMVASNYLPTIELGRRRRRITDEPTHDMTEDEMERRWRERRRARATLLREEDEDMVVPLRRGGTYGFQLAFTNPLYDPIQIRLTTAHQARPPTPLQHHVHIHTSHFSVGALKEWSYDDDDDEESEADDALADEQGRSKQSRMTMGSSRHRGRDTGVEMKGNVTKVGLDVEIGPSAEGPIEVSAIGAGASP